MKILPLILSGGSGTRIWPLSRPELPKQFLNLWGDSTLLQQTALRLEGVSEALPPLVITNQTQRFLVAEQLQAKGIVASGILLEPLGRNTAPAVALGALWALAQQEDVLLLVLPSDHVVTHPENFRRLVQDAAHLATAGKLVTFGIPPETPHTGYGYIRRGAPCPEVTAYDVDRFVEKPDLARAIDYQASGDYYWNSGMFMFRASVYVSELKRLRPDILAHCEASLASAQTDQDFIRLDPRVFGQCPSESIDYAVMEHTAAAVVLEAGALGWSDIGAWSALADLAPQDTQGNTLVGDVLIEDVHRCYLRAESRLVTALGVEDLVVIETSDAILVTRKDRSQDVKRLVDRLNARAARG